MSFVNEKLGSLNDKEWLIILSVLLNYSNSQTEITSLKSI